MQSGRVALTPGEETTPLIQAQGRRAAGLAGGYRSEACHSQEEAVFTLEGDQRMPVSTSNHQAIVIGGSMAGLLVARVLADVFERVTIVERDRFPAGPEPRKGLPQARHIHV